jgi:hypothetical protein
MVKEAKIERSRLRKVDNVAKYVKYNQKLKILETAVYKGNQKLFGS